MSGRTAPRIGIVLCLVAILLLGVPYLVLDPGERTVYYGVGPVSPLFLVVLPAVTLVAFGGGLQGRSDAATAAGATVGISLLFAVFVALWAVAAGPVVGGLTVSSSFEYHRWALLATAVLTLGTALFFTRSALRGDVPQGP